MPFIFNMFPYSKNDFDFLWYEYVIFVTQFCSKHGKEKEEENIGICMDNHRHFLSNAAISNVFIKTGKKYTRSYRIYV